MTAGESNDQLTAVTENHIEATHVLAGKEFVDLKPTLGPARFWGLLCPSDLLTVSTYGGSDNRNLVQYVASACV